MMLYCAIDLHSENNVPVIINDNDNILFQRRLPNDLGTVLSALEPYRQRLEGVCVESTFNWYWLVDGLIEAGYNTSLVNTAKVKPYSGLKHTEDKYDAFWLAHLMRLGILPTGYIYPREQRALRDLLRKRRQLVNRRTIHVLSIQNQYWRNTGIKLKSNCIKRSSDYLGEFGDENIHLAMVSNYEIMQALDRQIIQIESRVKQQIKLRPEYELLLTVDGIGFILALTIMLETGEISRFKKVGNYASYCRCVESKHTSNNKKKGEGNTKNGNRYLAWAFIEAANFARRFNEKARRFHQKKLAKTNGVVATKALAVCRQRLFN
ncbi:IS110 family transposase [Desulfobacterota bacterium AH_259_B03_O07]|nr:IS110 family transposase [Desulfobacterota bacterium AH_259_B03_O07]